MTDNAPEQAPEVTETTETSQAVQEETTSNEQFLNTDIDLRIPKEQLGNLDKSLSKFLEEDNFNVSKALKSLQNAEKLIGKRLDEADPEMLESVLDKLGVPKSADEYEISAEEGISEDKIKEFKELAKEAGISKSAAQKLFDKLNASPDEATQLAHEKMRIEKQLTQLKEEFGDKYDIKKEAANKALELFGSDTLKQEIATSGLGTNPEFIKFLSGVGEKFISKNINSAVQQAPQMSSDDAAKKIRDIRSSSDYKQALSNPYGGEFKAIQNELSDLYKLLG